MSINNCITSLLQIKEAIVTKVLEEDTQILVEVKLPVKEHICPNCGSLTNKTHDYRLQKINHGICYKKPTYILFKKRRYVCSACNKRFYEENSIVAKYQRISNRINQMIIFELSNIQSMKNIAALHNCSVSTVVRKTNFLSYSKPTLPETFGIDEFKGNTGARFQCIITDVVRMKTLDILKSRNTEDLVEYFMEYSLEERSKVKFVVMDMCSLFRSVINLCFPNAQIIVDKFHFVRQVLTSLDEIRKQEQRNFGTDKRKYFKKSRYILSKNYAKLNLEDRLQLSAMLNQSRVLRQAYALKEFLLRALNHPDPAQRTRRLYRWEEYVRKVNIPRFKTLMNTMRNWRKGILLALETNYTNGYTEGCNNRAKVLKRVSYGLRNFERFRNRLLFIANTKKVA